MQRRNFVKAVTLSVALAAAGVTSFSALAADTIKVGILHSLSGTMAISEGNWGRTTIDFAPPESQPWRNGSGVKGTRCKNSRTARQPFGD